MRNSIFIMFMLMGCSVAFAGDYVCYDTDTKKVSSRHRSVDGADLKAKGNCIQVTRSEFEEVNDFYKFDKGSLVEMKKSEKDAINQAKEDKKNEKKNFYSALETKLKGLGLTDAEVAFILSR